MKLSTFRDLTGKMSCFSTASQTQPAEALGCKYRIKSNCRRLAPADAIDPFGGHTVCANSTINCGIV